MCFVASTNVSKPILKSNVVVFNPYPALGCPSVTCWPRGFPLSEIQNEDTWKTSYENFTTQMSTFAVLQSLADIQPDVDAIFRMTQKTPFIFKKPDLMCKLRIDQLVFQNLSLTTCLKLVTHFEVTILSLQLLTHL